MGTDDSTGDFVGHINISFDLNNLTVSGNIKLPDGSISSVENANGAGLY